MQPGVPQQRLQTAWTHLDKRSMHVCCCCLQAVSCSSCSAAMYCSQVCLNKDSERHEQICDKLVAAQEVSGVRRVVWSRGPIALCLQWGYVCCSWCWTCCKALWTCKRVSAAAARAIPVTIRHMLCAAMVPC
jgi:hypothetical protein